MGMGADGLEAYSSMPDAAAKAGGQANFALLQQAAAAAATDAARMSAQQQANQQQQQQAQQHYQQQQQQMYSKSMESAQQQYGMNDVLAGMSSSGFPAAMHQQPGAGHGMQDGQQYNAAELLASLGYTGDPAAAAAAMMGGTASQAGGSGMQPGFMQQLQEYYMSGDSAAAAASAGYMQDGLGNEYGAAQMDFAQQQSGGGDAHGSHAGGGQGYGQVRVDIVFHGNGRGLDWRMLSRCVLCADVTLRRLQEQITLREAGNMLVVACMSGSCVDTPCLHHAQPGVPALGTQRMLRRCALDDLFACLLAACA
jgi:hypothetical protein